MSSSEKNEDYGFYWNTSVGSNPHTIKNTIDNTKDKLTLDEIKRKLYKSAKPYFRDSVFGAFIEDSMKYGSGIDPAYAGSYTASSSIVQKEWITETPKYDNDIDCIPLKKEVSRKDRYLSFSEILEICNVPNVTEHKIEKLLKRSVFNSESLSEVCIPKETPPEDSIFKEFLQHLADSINQEMIDKDEISDIDESIRNSYNKIYNDSNLEEFLKKNDILNNKYFKFLLAIDDKIVVSQSEHKGYKTFINHLKGYIISVFGRRNNSVLEQDKIPNLSTDFGIKLSDDIISYKTSGYLAVLHYIDNDKDLKIFDPLKTDANFICKYGFLAVLTKNILNLEIILVNNKLEYRVFSPTSTFVTQSITRFKELVKSVKKEMKSTKMIRENDDIITED